MRARRSCLPIWPRRRESIGITVTSLYGTPRCCLLYRLIGPDFRRCIGASARPWNFERQAKWSRKLVILHWKHWSDVWRIFLFIKILLNHDFLRDSLAFVPPWSIWVIWWFFWQSQNEAAEHEILDDLKSNDFFFYVSPEGYHYST